MGWSKLGNGILLSAAAEAGFDCFLTVDQSVEFQQNLAALPLPVILLVAPNNQIKTLAVASRLILTCCRGHWTASSIGLRRKMLDNW
jgi:hypothetical protein